MSARASIVPTLLRCVGAIVSESCIMSVSNGPVPPYGWTTSISACDGLANIHLKDPETAITRKFEFALRHGRICFRPNPATTGVREPWRLLGGDGLPNNDGGDPAFPNVSAVTAITADADEVVALGDSG
jgi:hypothetical protein